MAKRPILTTDTTGSNQSGAGSGDAYADSEQLTAAADGLTSVNVKPNATRSFLFAIPTTWLSVAAVRHDWKDNPVGRRLHGVFGYANRGPQAMETDSTALTWVREDVARKLGLISDANFPAKADKAWGAVAKAEKALVDADKKYWDARRDVGARLTADLAAAEAALAALGDPSDLPALNAAAEDLSEELRDAGAEYGWADMLQADEEAAVARRDALAGLVAERDEAQRLRDQFSTRLDALLATAETAAEVLHRVRGEADRLTRWHQLAATEEGRRQLGSTPEPAEVTYNPPAAPKDKPKDKPKEQPKEAPKDKPKEKEPKVVIGADARPAHAVPPWQSVSGQAGRRFDTATDHRVLTATDPDGASYVYDLVAPEGDGNGFYAAVQATRGRQSGTRRLAELVSYNSRLPAGASLDPKAVFHLGELKTRLGPGFRNDANLQGDIVGNGGRLPDALTAGLTPVQRESLVRLNLRSARRWDSGTAQVAAAVTADVLGVGLTLVAENGSYQYFEGTDEPFARFVPSGTLPMWGPSVNTDRGERKFRRYGVMKVRDMRLRRHGVVAIAVLGLMASAVVPAAAERGGGGGGGLGSAKAAAFALDVDVSVLGALPLDVGPLARLRVSGDAGPRYVNVAKAEVPPLIEALVLATGAQTRVTKGVYSKASARVATVKLKLLGELLIKLLKTGCEVSSDGVNVESDIVFADGSVLNGLVSADMLALAARPNSRLSVPLVGDLILNEQKIEKTSSPHGNQVTVTVNALHLVLDGILGKGDVTVAQSMCRAGGKNVGKDLKVVSTTNGNDTSNQIGEGDGDVSNGGGLLDGLLGGGDDGGLLGVNHLLGGGLLNGAL